MFSTFRFGRVGHRLAKRMLSNYPAHEIVGMPSLSPTMTVGTVGAWNKKVGDKVTAGDTIAEIQTDKASMAFESQEEFFIAKLLVPMGSEVAVGAPILITVEDESSVAAFANYDVSAANAAAAAPSTTADLIAPAAAAVESVPTGPQLFMPAARHLIESKHLNTDKMKGTSKGGRINKADVLLAMKAGLAVPGAAPAHATTSATASTAATAAGSAAPLAQATVTPVKAATPSPAVVVPIKLEDPTGGVPINSRYTDIPNTNMRKIIAKRLTESKATVPHYYVTMECEIDELLELRKQFKKDFDVNVSVNDFVIRASALALRDVPQVNSKWDVKTNAVLPPGPVDISIAVATPAGLITPIVPATDKRGIDNISQKVKDLAKRAKDNKLKPEEFQGGSFTISNLGMFGISSFSAVINPPQAAILAVGGGVPRVVPPSHSGGKPRTVTTLQVQLSADRRVIDEALAGQFLQVFRSYLNNPTSMLL